MPSSKYTPPSLSKTDAAHAITRAGLGAIPFAGAATVELFNSVVIPPLVKRQQEWMERVGKSLLSLESVSGLSLESLENNDGFIDVVLKASHIALRTSQELKLEALKNTIINSVISPDLGDSKRHIFLGCLDSFTSWHLSLLAFLDTSYVHLNKNEEVETYVYIEEKFPDLASQKEFYKLLGKDLYSNVFINNANFESSPSGNLPRSQTTDLGKEFLAFIQTKKTKEPNKAFNAASGE
jgi:hypothetical protein